MAFGSLVQKTSHGAYIQVIVTSTVVKKFPSNLAASRGDEFLTPYMCMPLYLADIFVKFHYFVSILSRNITR